MEYKDEIIKYINDNLSEHLTLEGLCEHFHTNRTTLARKIKALTGMAPIQYILEQRLTKSCNDLVTTDMSISEIAEKYGFADDNYYIRAFKKRFGTSPLQYRKLGGANTNMTVDEFVSYIKRGLGRAITLLRKEQNKKPFREAVFDLALNDPRYDRQCNGARGHYIMDLLECFDDTEALYGDILREYRRADHPDRRYHIENLEQWTEGCDSFDPVTAPQSKEEAYARKARHTLFGIYDNLYRTLLDRPQYWFEITDPVRDDYCEVASALYKTEKTFLPQLIRDMVTLVSEGDRFDITVFTDFFDEYINIGNYKIFKETFDEIMKNDPVARGIYKQYISEGERTTKIRQSYYRHRDPETGELYPDPKDWKELIDRCVKLGNPLMRISCDQKVWGEVSDEDILEIAKTIENEKDIKRRTALLVQLRRYGYVILARYPLDPTPLVEEIKENSVYHTNDMRMVKELGIVVSCIRHPSVRALALECLPYREQKNGLPAFDNAFNAFLTNYTPADKKYLVELVKNSYSQDDLHSMAQSVKDAIQFERVKDMPDDILVYLYENLTCTSCRAVLIGRMQMKYQHDLPAPEYYLDMIYEALYDGDPACRSMARSAVKCYEGKLTKDAHKYCSNNRSDLEKDEVCGCFYCQQIFSPKDIDRWIDNGNTAMCPYCGIDSVITESSGYPITPDFLSKMHDRWFSMGTAEPVDFHCFEMTVISEIIKDYPEYTEKLKAQIAHSRVEERIFTGHGFYTDFDVETEYSLGDGVDLHLGRVNMKINNLKHGTDYILWIKDGLITCLEGVAYDEEFPEEIYSFERINRTSTFENIFTREPDEINKGDYYFRVPWFEENNSPCQIARNKNMTMEEYTEWKKDFNQRIFAYFKQRRFDLPFDEEKNWEHERFIQGDEADSRITEILQKAALTETPFIELGGALHMGIAPYILHLNPRTPCLMTSDNRYDMQDLRDILDKDYQNYNVHIAVCDDVDVPIKDNSVELITGVRSLFGTTNSKTAKERAMSREAWFKLCRKQIIEKAYRILKPGGRFIVSHYISRFVFDWDELDNYFKTHEKLYGLYTKDQLYTSLHRHLSEDKYMLTDDELTEAGFEIEIKREHVTKDDPKRMASWFSMDGEPERLENLLPEDDIIGLEFTDILYVLRKPENNKENPNDPREKITEIGEFKTLIETAKSDMAAHPAFPQELIRYEAFAAESAKGNIYHAILDLNGDDEDKVIAKMKQNDDTHVIRFISMFCDDECSIGSHKLREKLRRLHPENGNTELLWTTLDGCRRHKLKELNPLYFSNDLNIFEFHDAEFEITRHVMNPNDLYLSVKYLNVQKNTEQNPTDSDMEIKEARVIFHNFYMVYLRNKTRYQPNEKGDLVPTEGSEVTLFGEQALQYLFDRSKESRVLTILELEKTEDGKYSMTVCTSPGEFDMKFTISSAAVLWDEYSGEAWYEQYFRDMRARGIIPKRKEEE